MAKKHDDQHDDQHDQTNTEATSTAATLHERAAQIAREDVADHDALASTDERERPVAVTSDHERRARAGMAQYAVTVQRADGRQTIVRVEAVDESDARSLVEYLVRTERTELDTIAAEQESIPAGHVSVEP